VEDPMEQLPVKRHLTPEVQNTQEEPEERSWVRMEIMALLVADRRLAD
jgi:hypothetical protein